MRSRIAPVVPRAERVGTVDVVGGELVDVLAIALGFALPGLRPRLARWRRDQQIQRVFAADRREEGQRVQGGDISFDSG